MQIALDQCVIRSFRFEDEESLAQYANNYRVWRNMRDVFPHPYTREHAREFIAAALGDSRKSIFAIEVEGSAAGVIGIRHKSDIDRVGGELGYWLGEPFWGRGLMTDVVRAFVPFAFEKFQLERIEAFVFEWNPASARVLEKSGFEREATLRRSAIKDGQVIDRWLYACLASVPLPRATGSANSVRALAPVPG